MNDLVNLYAGYTLNSECFSVDICCARLSEQREHSRPSQWDVPVVQSGPVLPKFRKWLIYITLFYCFLSFGVGNKQQPSKQAWQMRFTVQLEKRWKGQSFPGSWQNTVACAGYGGTGSALRVFMFICW